MLTIKLKTIRVGIQKLVGEINHNIFLDTFCLTLFLKTNKLY